MKKWMLLALVCCLVSQAYVPHQALAQGYYNLYANDGTYLGNTNSNQADPNSVNNPYGKYGSAYSSNSVNNPYGKYGSQYSAQSPRDRYAQPGVAAPQYGAMQYKFGGNTAQFGGNTAHFGARTAQFGNRF